MTIRPPPPPSRGSIRRRDCPVPGEGEVLARWEVRVRRRARRVRGRYRLGLEIDDVEAELRMALLDVIRAYYAETGRLAPDPLLMHALKWRHQHLERAGRVPYRVFDEQVRAAIGVDDDGQAEPEVADTDTMIADAAMVASEQEEVYEALVYALRRDLPPAAFAILHLRAVEELTPREIAAMTGIPTNTQVSKRLAAAKRVALDILRAIGVYEWSETSEMEPDDVYAD